MLFALIAVAVAAVAGIADFSSDAIEEELDRLEDELERELENLDLEELLADLEEGFDPPERGAGVLETIEGSDGADTLSGDAGDEDVLLGLEGDDRLELADQNSAMGGSGADVFLLQPGSDSVVTDFQLGEDRLRIEARELNPYVNPTYAMDWRITEEGAELHYSATGIVDENDESRLVTLLGLTTPPDPTDVELALYDPVEDETTTLTGADLNFLQRIEGGTGADSLILDDTYSVYEVETGAGADRVTFDSFRAETDLGPGDDSYRSEAEVRYNNPLRDASETVFGGDGDDTIEGGTAGFVAFGGTGDDTISAIRSQQRDILYAELNGGPGDDRITFGDQAIITGGEGADLFTVLPQPFERPAFSQILDFDPAEDAVIIQIDSLYDGPGELTLTESTFGYGSAVRVDGEIAVQFSRTLTNLDGIVLLQA